jgi:hypothetical protein
MKIKSIYFPASRGNKCFFVLGKPTGGRLTEVKQAQCGAFGGFLGDHLVQVQVQQIAQGRHIKQIPPQLGLNDLFAMFTNLSLKMGSQLLFGLLQRHIPGVELFAGMNLDTAAFRNRLHHGPIGSGIRLLKLGENIQNAAVTEE